MLTQFGFYLVQRKLGLKNSDLALANMIINIPTNKAFGSFKFSYVSKYNML